MTDQWNPRRDMPDLTGKVAVVTGGNSDIGRETIKLLASHGAKVHFTVRSEAKGVETQKRLLESDFGIDPSNIQWMKMDLSELSSITTAVDDLKRRERKVDILINNAAANTWSTEPVAGGWEIHMAVNLVGPFLLTNRLLSLLKSAAAEKDSDVRILTISSTAQVAMLPSDFKFPFDSPDCLSNPVPSHPWKSHLFGRFFGFDMVRYSVSKAANFVFAQELQRQLDGQGSSIISLAVHPGEVATEGLFSINNMMVRTIAKLSFLTPEQGAASPAFAAASKDVRKDPARFKGKFLVPVGKIGKVSPAASDSAQVQGLWQHTTAEVNRQLLKEGLPSLQPW
ncbi:hypothetical protein CkaCkLH20_06815 [Colletotrichum karsti]|uniref:Uncharacterized protein n=1 Tax=Colletotrichum karsti TaxID=1095194 RepID=A0A9P6I3S6_9PEZI|nr:uncharacterized protein CkaCkLH20_06815 [Colletotrichum karsti]KAF9875883.1 hypothetical protein CkaCkLH20_06815 [Colletotrichum karsti]